jgi:hypothetical protein
MNDSSSFSGPGIGKNSVKKMGGWHRLNAAGAKAQKSCLSQHANPSQTILRRVLFCAGDTLPFLAIFSKALIFFLLLFFASRQKKVSRLFEVLTSKDKYL